MSRFQELKDLFKRRLINAARAHLFEHFEESISGVEKKIDHKRKLLDLVLYPDVKLQRTESPADVQQLLETREDVPGSSRDHQDPDPSHIKEEHEEVWTSQEGGQLQELEEVDITKFILTPGPVKSDDDEEKPQSSQLHQTLTEEIKTEADGEDCGGSEPDRNSHPDTHLQPDTDDKTSDSSKLDTDGSDFWKETRQHPSVSDSHVRCKTDRGQLNPSENDKAFTERESLSHYMALHTEVKREDPDPPQIKEEQEEVWTSQEGDQFQGLEEVDITKFTFTPVPVKSEDDEEKPQSSHLHQRLTEQMETEADGEDCGGSEPDRNSHPDTHLLPDTADKTPDFYEPDTDECDFICSVCNNRFRSKSLFRYHRCDPESSQNHPCDEPKKRFCECPDCGKKFRYNSHLIEHQRTHTGEQPFNCSDCGKKFTSKRALWKHTIGLTEEKPFRCSVCGKFFNHVCLRYHMKSHIGEKPFECSLCGKKFEYKLYLETHMTTHTGEEPFVCTVCNKRFISRSQFQHHKCGPESSQKQPTKKRKKPLKLCECSECGKKFDRMFNLTLHQRTHTGGKPFSCSACDKKFTSQGSLNRHMIGQKEEKPFRCSVCGKLFNHACLRYHMKSHTGEKPFECSRCSRKFAYKVHLESHMKSHTGDELFGCIVCNKRFTSAFQLQKHKCADDSCSVFGETFEHSDTLVEHMTHHTRPEENPFCCSDCGEGYRWQYQLKIHECPAKSSQQSKTDFKKNDCGDAQQSRTLDPERHSKPDTDKKSLVSSDTNGSADISFWKETIDEGCQTDKKSFTPIPIKSEDDEKKRLNPSENDKAFTERESLSQYMALHTEVKREDPDPPHIKEEQEEVCTSQEGDQFQGLEEVDITKFILTPVPVKSEDDEEKPQSSHLHQRLTEEIKTEADGEDCGGSEPDRNSHPDTHLLPDPDDKTSDSSEPDSDDSDFWTPIRKSHV